MNIFTNLNDPQVANRLLAGQVGVIPSDSIYGLMCVASNPQAVQRLYELKQRDGKPGTLVGASMNQFIELGLDAAALDVVQVYWPGAISAVIPCDSKLSYLHLGKDSLAVRIPDLLSLQQLLEKTGVLQTTSANYSGQPTANTIADAQRYFGDTVDFYVDGGDLSHRQPSTVISVENGRVEVLRHGAVSVVSNL